MADFQERQKEYESELAWHKAAGMPPPKALRPPKKETTIRVSKTVLHSRKPSTVIEDNQDLKVYGSEF